MVRKAWSGIAMSLLLIYSAMSLAAQSGPSSLESYFNGKQVRLKIDMPGTQQGVDLKYGNGTPMDWKQYSSRVKKFGAAIRKGDNATVTTIVVKKDMIEFQLDGGGFGTFGDDTNTTVEAKVVEKSSYEKQLERDIANTDDPDRKRELQRDLDRERSRRERQNAENQRAAQVASQIKAQQVAGSRMSGGSRFNLRWKRAVPADELSPEMVMKLLADYVDFSELQGGGQSAPMQNGVESHELPPGANPPTGTKPEDSGASAGSPTAQLKRGMQLSEVTALLGQGRQLSESTSADGLKTQVVEYLPGDRRVEVTYVDGLVIKYSITSR
jgi:hypothetical protein